MPVYEYQCTACSEEFEELVFSGKQEKRIRCPACASGKIQKRISLFGFSSKGGDVSPSQSSGCSGCSATSCAGCSPG